MASLQEKFEQLQQNLSTFDVNDIDFNNVGSWPLASKVSIWLVVFALVVAGSYQLNLAALHARLQAEEKKEVGLKDEFEKKVNEAANLEAYRAQMVEMEKSFEALLKQLPADTEVPGLLDDISAKGLDSGLTFKTIDLKAEKSSDYYIELPIEITVAGGYHDFGSFVSGIAALPRIVTLDDFAIELNTKKPGASGGDAASGKGAKAPKDAVPTPAGQLNMKINAKTYRYKPIEDKEGA